MRDRDNIGALRRFWMEAIFRFLWNFCPAPRFNHNVEVTMSLADPKDLVAAAQQGKVGKQVHCRVCGTELTGKLMLCGRCETPHHQDCWDYNGGCAIYGCQASSDRAREARSLSILDWLAAIVVILAAVACMVLGPVAIARSASQALYKRPAAHPRVYRSQNSSTPQRYQDDSSNVNRPHRCTQ